MNSSKLKGYLTGLIFGDGYIDKGVTKRAFCIKSINKDFIDKIEKDLISCTNFTIIRKTNLAYENHKENYELRIKAHPYFAKKYHHFYGDKKERIASKESLNWLNDVGLANWYMCDGYITLVGKTKGYIRSRRIELCTDRYELSTIQKMQQALKKNFNIECSIIKRDRFYRLRIKTESYKIFINLVRPYIVNSMLYKLYLGYEQKPKWMDDNMWEYQVYLKSAIAPN